MNKRLTIIFLLGFSSGLPLALLTSTLQAWFSDSGVSVLATGFLSLVGLPYVYKVLWTPLVDKFCLLSLGLRRSWILVTQLCLFLGFLLMSFFSPTDSAKLLSILALCLAFFSATQDSAIDAQRVEYLATREHALGASLAVFGYRTALLLAGGLALVLASHFGFANTYRAMAMLMLVGIFATLYSSEPSKRKPKPNLPFSSYLIQPFKEMAKRSEFLPLLLFIVLYKAGEAFTTTVSGIIMPFLIQGIGFSLDTIGYINKILGISSILLGGLVAGILLLRWSLYRALFCFGLLQALTNVLFLLLSIVGKNVYLFAAAVIADNFVAGMASTALVALFMRIVNEQYTATQFSLLVAIASLPRVFSGPIGALLQMQFGWVGLYEIACVLALGFIPFLLSLKTVIINGFGTDVSCAKI